MNIFDICEELEIMKKVSGWNVFYNDSDQLRMKHSLYSPRTFCPIAAMYLYQTGEIAYASGGAIYAVAQEIGIERRTAETFIRSVDFLDNCCWGVTTLELQVHIRVSSMIAEKS
jgi:hypothetical protein